MPPNFRGGAFLGGVPPNFRGGAFFWGVPANFRGGAFFGGVPPNFRGGAFFWGGVPSPEYGQRSAGTHPTGMHSCNKNMYPLEILSSRNYVRFQLTFLFLENL